MTTEYREVLKGDAKRMAEHYKGRLRAVRKKVEKQRKGLEKDMSEDDMKLLKNYVRPAVKPWSPILVHPFHPAPPFFSGCLISSSFGDRSKTWRMHTWPL